ncbi:hypothetical protein C5S36_03625 [Candidatus Methanophagaceae archaeon]|nr:hypothetical protein C5S36_03600 [Methanophagales archaeon]KAF5435223.1 hypothetical protein C5S36_03625 [Methanophagales archaeon]
MGGWELVAESERIRSSEVKNKITGYSVVTQ